MAILIDSVEIDQTVKARTLSRSNMNIDWLDEVTPPTGYCHLVCFLL